MKIIDILLQEEELVSNPIPMTDIENIKGLFSFVNHLINNDIEPESHTIHPSNFYATQGWLSSEGGYKPFPEYDDKPILCYADGKLNILDGHHRSTEALAKDEPIDVYVFGI